MTPSTPPLDVVVVGGGITGLAAAFWLRRGGARVALLESSARVGGALHTLSREGFTFELGPNTVLAYPAVDELLAAADLTADREVAAPSAGKRYIWWDGALHALPGGPLGMLTTPLFTLGAKLALLREPFVPPPSDDREESIADFVRRRLGAVWLERAITPFVGGVYAGDPEKLSVRWAVPRLAALEREHGSLIRGALAKRRAPQSDGKVAAAPSKPMIGYRGGFSALAEALAQRIGDVRTGVAVESLLASDGGFALTTSAGPLAARRVVLAAPAEATAELLATASDGASLALAEVSHAAVAVVCLGFRREQVRHALDGFGFLCAKDQGLRLLGCLFTSSLFPGRAPAGCVGLTAFVGGAREPGLARLPEPELLQVVKDDLARALGTSGEPVFQHVQRWSRAIPQYEVGHAWFVKLKELLESRLPGLHLAGNYTGGVSVPDCMARGAEVAGRVLAELGGEGASAAEEPRAERAPQVVAG